MLPSSLLSQADRRVGHTMSVLSGHQHRVGDLLDLLCAQLGRPPSAALSIAAYYHDIGKIAMLRLIESDASLTEQEWAVIRRHPILSAQFLEQANQPEAARIVRAHHERWDGTGYPDGLAGEAIPADARLLALADAIAAMTEPRAYRPKQPAVLDELRRGAGTQFDPALIPAAIIVARTLLEVTHSA